MKLNSSKITYSVIVSVYDIVLTCILISDLCNRMGYSFDVYM
ncbi:MAG: hypothetical protein ACI4KH_02330 [Oscillospiraceae bacterium]